MNKIELDERIENAMNAFTTHGPHDGLMATTYGHSGGALIGSNSTLSAKADKWSRLLRELLLFGPGAFCLYFITLMVLFFYPEAGLGFGGVCSMAFAAFLTYAGAGDLRQTKNLAVPATVIVGAVIVSVVRSLFPLPEDLRPYFSYAFYLFPFVLVAAKLVQMRVADRS